MIILSLSKVSFPESAGDNRDDCDNRHGRWSRLSPIVMMEEYVVARGNWLENGLFWLVSQTVVTIDAIVTGARTELHFCASGLFWHWIPGCPVNARGFATMRRGDVLGDEQAIGFHPGQ